HAVISHLNQDTEEYTDQTEEIPQTVNGFEVGGYNGGPMLSATSMAAASYNSGSWTVKESELGVDVTCRYYSSVGASDLQLCQERVETTCNMLNSFWVRDCMLSYTLGLVVIRTDSETCPYWGLGTAGINLSVGHDEWNNNPGTYGTSYDNTIICDYGAFDGGMAWMPSASVCSWNRFSVNAASSWADYTWWPVAKHELGHNWGCNDYHGSCEEGSTIMCGNSIGRFAGQSVDAILYYRDSASCLTDIGLWPVDIAPYAHIDSYLANGNLTLTSEASVTIDVLANDHDANGDDIDIYDFDTTSVLGGTISLSEGTGPGGRDELTYTAEEGVDGKDWFHYTIGDSSEMLG
ncbi:MAG: hypothetical protein GY794_11695, partial [bacterium]|nr:hypothetical protein [bacterium]